MTEYLLKAGPRFCKGRIGRVRLSRISENLTIKQENDEIMLPRDR